MTALVVSWIRHRPVQRAAVAVLVLILAGGAMAGWRLAADRESASTGTVDASVHGRPSGRGTASPRDLADGHRYLLVPATLLAMAAIALAGSVVAHDAADGLAASIAVSGRSTTRSLAALVLSSAVAATAWFTTLAVVGVGVALSVISAAGHSSDASSVAVVPTAVLLARCVLTVFGLGCLTSAVGLVWPGASAAAYVVLVGPLAAEVALGLVTSSVAALVPFGSWAVLGAGRSAVEHVGAPDWLAFAIPAGAWGGGPLVAAVGVLIVVRWRPVP